MTPSKTVLITGGTGLIGTALTDKLLDRGYRLIILTRQTIDHPSKPIQYVNDLSEINTQVDIIVNLAGESLANRRWTPAFKEQLVTSRVNLTQSLFDWAKQQAQTIPLLISASAIGFYGPHSDDAIDESAPSHTCFSSQLCENWERTALQFTTLDTRVCIPRIGVVLSRHGGALQQMATPFRFFVGGKIGSGKQWFSWIHISDLINIILYLIDKENASGVYNATAPTPVDNQSLTTHLSQILHRPQLFAMPAPILRLLLGQMAEELLLTGQKVIPKRLLEDGFKFNFPTIGPALEDCLN